MLAIKKVIDIKHKHNLNENIEAFDQVELTWFDMQKPNLTALTNKGINFMVKAQFTHLHDHDILLCDDGYRIEVIRAKDEIYQLEFQNSLTFAKNAYAIGNRHQPLFFEDLKITVLADISINDIIKNLQQDKQVKVSRLLGYFSPNGKAHHSH